MREPLPCYSNYGYAYVYMIMILLMEGPAREPESRSGRVSAEHRVGGGWRSWCYGGRCRVT